LSRSGGCSRGGITTGGRIWRQVWCDSGAHG
jgi:hypothetical protein